MISIHPSRVGWDGYLIMEFKSILEFQSTHPVWDGTYLIPDRHLYQ